LLCYRCTESTWRKQAVAEWTKTLQGMLLQKRQQLEDIREDEGIFVITLGANGAVLLSTEEWLFQPSIKTTNVVDTTGAGDAFAAALLTFKLKYADSNVDCLIKAHIAASAKIGHKGGTNGHLDPKQIQALFEDLKKQQKDSVKSAL